MTIFDQDELKRYVLKYHYYPVWKCPDCGWLNKYLNTFFEICDNCGKDHTLDWIDHEYNGETK